MYKYELLTLLEKVLMKSYQMKNGEHAFHCPFCNHHKPKLSINLDRGVKCWVCNWSTPKISRIVRRVGNYKQVEDWKEFDDTVDINDFSLDLFQKKEKKTETALNLPEEFTTLTNNKTPRSALFAMKYLRGRGIQKKDILHWKIGYCDSGEYENRIIIPSFNMQGRVDYFMARTYTNGWPKYKNPPAAKDIVFSELWIDWAKPVILVEGIFDAIKAGPNSIPLLGSSLRENSRLFQSIVKHDPAVYLALDKDAKNKANHMAKKFLQYGIELYKIDITQYNDIGEMTNSEFSSLKEKTPRIDSELQLITQTLLEQESR